MKTDFINDFLENGVVVTKMVVAVILPTGATEIIINTEEI